MIDLSKFAIIRDRVAERRGPLVLFGLFMPEASEQWDVVVAGPNLHSLNQRDLEAVSEVVVSCLTDDELLDVSRIVIMESDLDWLQPQLIDEVETDRPVLRERFILGRLPIQRAYVFSAHAPQLAGAAR